MSANTTLPIVYVKEIGDIPEHFLGWNPIKMILYTSYDMGKTWEEEDCRECGPPCRYFPEWWVEFKSNQRMLPILKKDNLNRWRRCCGKTIR